MHLPLPKISTTLKALMFPKGIGMASTLYSLLDFPRSLASGLGSEPGQRVNVFKTRSLDSGYYDAGMVWIVHRSLQKSNGTAFRR